MQFNNDKPIYLQLADRLSDDIVDGKYNDDDRVPSVREFGMCFEVNTNTAVKAYDMLSRDNVIYNRRGLGYFVTPGAREKIMESRRTEFMNSVLPDVFRQMRMLGIGIEELTRMWKEDIKKLNSKV
mgnify:FL=1